MAKSKHKTGNRTSLKIIGGLTFIGLLIVYFFFFSSMGRTSDKEYVYIDEDDNIDSVYQKLEPISTKHSLWTFKQLAKLTSYKDHIRTGRYQISSSGALQTLPSLQERKPGTRITDPTICQNERRPCKECKRKAHVLKGSTSRQPQLQRDM